MGNVGSQCFLVSYSRLKSDDNTVSAALILTFLFLLDLCLVSPSTLWKCLEVFSVTIHMIKCMGMETQGRDVELQQLLLIHDWQQCGGEKEAPLFPLQNFCIIQAFV